MRLSGEVRKGQLVIAPASLAIALRHFEGRRVVVEIEAERVQRSLRQNAYYHACVLPVIAHVLTEEVRKVTPDAEAVSNEEAHEALKKHFLGREVIGGLDVVRSTKRLSTGGMTDYIRAMPAVRGGGRLLDPGARQPRGGDGVKRGPKPTPAVDRFWPMVQRGAEPECWNWTGSVANGYGQLGDRPNRRTLKAHRLSWEIHFGAIPAGLQVCHRCDNRRCVNPAHLFLGTLQDNMDDMVAKGRQARGERVRPHRPSVGSARPRARLHETDIPLILDALSKGITTHALGAAFGVSASVISGIRRGVRWRHVAGAPA